MRSRAGREVAIGSGRGAARLIQLIDSSSQKVALEATKYALGAAGIHLTIVDPDVVEKLYRELVSHFIAEERAHWEAGQRGV